MKARSIVLVCLLMAVLVAAGCAPAKAPKSDVPAGYESLRLVATTIGGKSNTICMALAAVLNKYYPEIVWSSSSGASSTNVIYLTKGTMKLSWVTPAAYVDSYGFDKIRESRIRTISFPASPTMQFFAVPEDKPWKDITEIPKGLTLSPTSGAQYTCEAWLQLVGLSKKDFNWVPYAGAKTDAADAWRAGKVDVLFTSVGGPEPWLMDIQASPRRIRAMGLSPQQVTKAKAEQTFERVGFPILATTNIAEIAAQIFKYDVVSPQQPTGLAARDDFPEQIAYRIAKVIDEHRAELVQIFSPMKYGTAESNIQWAKPPLELHSGVTKYYKEKGYLK